MTPPRSALAAAICLALAACSSGGPLASGDGVFAPGVAGKAKVDNLVVGHRLMAAGEYELALDAYSRAAVVQGFNVDTLSALGSANLRLGRLGQAEGLLRRAAEEAPDFAPAWNNLGVLLMEKGEFAEAAEIFRRAFATDNGNSDEIRENLRLALSKRDAIIYDPAQENQNFELVRRADDDTIEPL
ncbi:tetratricopeptide repeat protein [Loktanella sp. R86503]|uniref:tetratricopeptide repeat protein n=1 Tax=Loktanella sp. R86503 TaxID=3093847 RepID=UPI0036DB4568